jgi:hypothetical protein
MTAGIVSLPNAGRPVTAKTIVIAHANMPAAAPTCAPASYSPRARATAPRSNGRRPAPRPVLDADAVGERP